MIYQVSEHIVAHAVRTRPTAARILQSRIELDVDSSGRAGA
ncbi:hypothetical protein BSIN_2217 [Burkholderia singularis]|uniref:Uncharacterized protein n=1 Tax=Burkholderia singularis TaxID=1503053 RepID=A0A238H153_9BURK|nr:hypothetical protein BSIN_2217 [Burkholderia singularis]